MSCDPNWLTRREAIALTGGLAAMLIGGNPVVGGTVLRRAAIQSPNFVAGSAGWDIRQDGSAEFNNVVIRNGQVVSGTALYYSGVPALGNLVASVSAAAGTDVSGNAYLAGTATYIPSGAGTNFAFSAQGNTLTWFTGPVNSNGAGPWSPSGTITLSSAGTQLQVGGFSAGISILSGLLLQALGGLVVGNGTTLGGGASVTGGLTADTEIVSASTNAVPIVDIISQLAGAAPAALRVTNAAAGDTALAARVSGDTTPRLNVGTTAGGLIQALLGPGNAAADITIRRLAANSLGILSADLAVDTAGRGLQVKEGTNAKQGTAVLSAGTVVVANTAVTANSRIMLTAQNLGTVTVPSALCVSARTAGTSFTIKASQATDTSTVAYEIFEPAP